jgi:hypothetical protein
MSNKLALFFFFVKFKETVAISTAHVFERHETFFIKKTTVYGRQPKNWPSGRNCTDEDMENICNNV